MTSCRKENIRIEKNRATLDQPCTDFSKSGGIQISTASLQAAPPPLFEKSVHRWSNVARFFDFMFFLHCNLQL